MRALILDMYGVILKDPEGGFLPFVNRTFPHLSRELGHPASDCIYVDDRRFNLEAAQSLAMDTVLFNSRNVQYEGKTVVSFKELADILIHL